MWYTCWNTITFKFRASWSLSASEDDKWLDVKKMERIYNSRTASTYNHNMRSQLSTGHLDAAQCASLIPLILIPGVLACLRFYWAHGVLIKSYIQPLYWWSICHLTDFDHKSWSHPNPLDSCKSVCGSVSSSPSLHWCDLVDADFDHKVLSSMYYQCINVYVHACTKSPSLSYEITMKQAGFSKIDNLKYFHSSLLLASKNKEDQAACVIPPAINWVRVRRQLNWLRSPYLLFGKLLSSKIRNRWIRSLYSLIGLIGKLLCYQERWFDRLLFLSLCHSVSHHLAWEK